MSSYDPRALAQVNTELDQLTRTLQTRPGFLRQLAQLMAEDDHVGLSFLLVTGLMLASSVFFFFQVFLVPRRWANSMIVCGLVTFVAWHHYMYMKDVWADTLRAPTIYRYMDWLITVPLQVIEFFLILSAANPVDREILGYNLFFRLLFASMLMLTFGYMGETGVMERWVAFVAGMFMWVYIVWEVYMGEAARIAQRLSLLEAKKLIAQFGVNNQDDDNKAQDERSAIKMQIAESKNMAAMQGTSVRLFGCGCRWG